MKLVADESVDRQIVDQLRNDGHDVWYVAEEMPSVDDEQVLLTARKQESVLVTADKDFGELVYRLRQANAGVILIRLAGLTPKDKANLTAKAISEHGNEMLQSFSVIGPRTIRIRRHDPTA